MILYTLHNPSYCVAYFLDSTSFFSIIFNHLVIIAEFMSDLDALVIIQVWFMLKIILSQQLSPFSQNKNDLAALNHLTQKTKMLHHKLAFLLTLRELSLIDIMLSLHTHWHIRLIMGRQFPSHLDLRMQMLVSSVRVLLCVIIIHPDHLPMTSTEYKNIALFFTRKNIASEDSQMFPYVKC